MASANPENLLRKIAVYNPKADLDMVRLAFDFAKDAHEGQVRKTGEPYITHPLAAAEILAEMRFPIPIVIAGLLHDVPEDTKVTVADIRKDFGDDVAQIVSGITKLGKIKYRGIDRYIENLRKMFMAMASDVRVVIVKCADRIHNLETLGALPPAKRKRIAMESLEIFAPIANRLGMHEIRTRLEDLAFKHALPKEYEWTSGVAAKAISARQGYIEKVQSEIVGDLKAANINVEVIQGRVKHLYSLYQKLLKRDRDIVRVHDLIALRIIVKSVGDCYAALGIIHARWKPLGGRIKDYISQQKPNGYKSLHTTVFCDGGEIVEFQIRTKEMHDEAERGIAAHWRYDEDGKESMEDTGHKFDWVKDLAKARSTMRGREASLESLEGLKIDTFSNRIFVFTPKGDVIDLPEGATPVDFAYAIHSRIGDTCISARVNDAMVALDAELQSGDYCEVMTDKNRKAPNPDWLKFVKTGHAKWHIRAAAKDKITKWIKDTEAIDPDAKRVPATGANMRKRKNERRAKPSR